MTHLCLSFPRTLWLSLEPQLALDPLKLAKHFEVDSSSRIFSSSPKSGYAIVCSYCISGFLLLVRAGATCMSLRGACNAPDPVTGGLRQT